MRRLKEVEAKLEAQTSRSQGLTQQFRKREEEAYSTQTRTAHHMGVRPQAGCAAQAAQLESE